MQRHAAAAASDLGLDLDKTLKLEWHKASNTRTRCLRITSKDEKVVRNKLSMRCVRGQACEVRRAREQCPRWKRGAYPYHINTSFVGGGGKEQSEREGPIWQLCLLLHCWVLRVSAHRGACACTCARSCACAAFPLCP